MSNVLDKVWVECLMPHEYEYLHHGVTQLGTQKQVQVRVIISNIIASLRVSTGVPLALGHGTSPCQNDKTNKQWTISALFYLLWV